MSKVFVLPLGLEAPDPDSSDGLLLRRVLCTTPDCREGLALLHFGAPHGIVRVLKCPKCGQASEFRATPNGIAPRAIKAK